MTGTEQAEHNIKVNDYGPDVKSLGFKTPEGAKATIGVINPGKEHTFQTELAEEVMVISGRLRTAIEGVLGDTILETGETAIFPAKSKITLEALDDTQVAYKCVYL